MPYTKSERPYGHEYKMQKKRGKKEHEKRMERQRARRAVDKRDTGTVTKKSPKRAGKDIAHSKMLSKGGSNKDGYHLQTPSKNRSNNGKRKGMKINKPQKVTSK